MSADAERTAPGTSIGARSGSSVALPPAAGADADPRGGVDSRVSANPGADADSGAEAEPSGVVGARDGGSVLTFGETMVALRGSGPL
ncbi:hypothetical protein [Streptomyces sp. Ac-502]|uniref:hypothetical protein n=1 Tax=Streptomyces sp. Ac-502 TaxID=3342801 RepID=UPI0038624C44